MKVRGGSQLITTTKTMADNATMVTVTTATRAIGCNRRGYVTNNKLLRLSKGLVLSRMMGMIDVRIQ